jgi:hypothetical protein
MGFKNAGNILAGRLAFAFYSRILLPEGSELYIFIEKLKL